MDRKFLFDSDGDLVEIRLGYNRTQKGFPACFVCWPNWSGKHITDLAELSYLLRERFGNDVLVSAKTMQQIRNEKSPLIKRCKHYNDISEDVCEACLTDQYEHPYVGDPNSELPWDQ